MVTEPAEVYNGLCFASEPFGQFTLGQKEKKSDKFRSFSYYPQYFIALTDDEIGHNNYNIETNTNKKNGMIRRTSFLEKIKRKYSSNYKYLEIYKNDYTDDWPFLAERVIIECLYKSLCLVEINGFFYSLNGSAKGYYNLIYVNESNLTIFGKSTNFISNMALAL